MTIKTYLNDRVDQHLPCHVLERSSEHDALEGGNSIRNDYYEAGVQVQAFEEPNEVDAVVRDEREFILDDTLGQLPVRLAAQTDMVDMGRLESGAMSDFDQRLMQAFVDQKPHALLSRVLSGKDFRPRAFFSCQGRRLGRPRRGNARMYSGAMAIVSLLRVG